MPEVVEPIKQAIVEAPRASRSAPRSNRAAGGDPGGGGVRADADLGGADAYLLRQRAEMKQLAATRIRAASPHRGPRASSRTPAYIKAEARDRLRLVMPGDTAYMCRFPERRGTRRPPRPAARSLVHRAVAQHEQSAATRDVRRPRAAQSPATTRPKDSPGDRPATPISRSSPGSWAVRHAVCWPSPTAPRTVSRAW